MAGKAQMTRKLTMIASTTKIGKVEMARRARAKSIVGAMFDEEDDDDKGKDEEQLTLTEKELKEELPRTLTSEDPNALKNIVEYSYKDKAFVRKPISDHTVYHIDIQNKVKSTVEPSTKTGSSIATVSGEMALSQTELPKKPLPNKFNYNDRAAQTYVLPLRNQEIQTLPPPRLVITGSVSQGEIYDAYYAHAEALAKGKMAKKDEVEVVGDDLSKISLTVKIMERMVNQNIYDEIMHDFKYWEDRADEFRSPEGMLLPLWKFVHDDARSISVTGLCWNTRYNDLFAVTYGSIDYLKQQHGMLCVYSLKNPAFPEYFYSLDCGVMCVDVHSEYPSLIAVGFFDGNVAVYNIKLQSKDPILMCDPKEGKHSGPVWKLKWQPNNLDGNINFSSVSSDGRVTNWVLFKSELRFSDTIFLDLPQTPAEGPGGAPLNIRSSGTALAFHPSNHTIFLVGTEEGIVYHCSKVYSNRYLHTYHAHSTRVQEIRWNKFNNDIFMSCSADWTVKIWDYHITRPLFLFDLNSAVTDIGWAPYAATVFAACTSEGKIFVYDLFINKYKPICEQIVVQKKGTKLTSIDFNSVHPVLIAGDSKGFTTCLKLSPNLRRAIRDNKTKDDPDKYREMEIAKLAKILAVVRLSNE